jgi:hypothetical protein
VFEGASETILWAGESSVTSRPSPSVSVIASEVRSTVAVAGCTLAVGVGKSTGASVGFVIKVGRAVAWSSSGVSVGRAADCGAQLARSRNTPAIRIAMCLDIFGFILFPL